MKALTSEERRAHRRLMAWAQYGKREELPALALELVLPPIHEPRSQRHAYRDGWWCQIALAQTDEQALDALRHWARVLTGTYGLTLPINDAAGRRVEGWVEIRQPEEPYDTVVRVWAPLSVDYDKPKPEAGTGATDPDAMADAHALMNLVRECVR